jgi:hypothetical protein
MERPRFEIQMSKGKVAKLGYPDSGLKEELKDGEVPSVAAGKTPNVGLERILQCFGKRLIVVHSSR